MNRNRRTNAEFFGRWTGVWFAFCLLVGLAWLGVLAWAIISLVMWVTR